MTRACSLCHQKAEDRLRSTLKNDYLDALLQVSINGPGVKDGHPLITTAVKEWLAKPRGKIAKEPSTEVQQPVKLQDAGVQVDTQSEEIERIWRVAEA